MTLLGQKLSFFLPSVCRKAFLLQLVDTQVAVAPYPGVGKDLEHGRVSSWRSQRARLECHLPNLGLPTQREPPPPGLWASWEETRMQPQPQGATPSNRQLQLPCLAAASLQASCLDETAEHSEQSAQNSVCLPRSPDCPGPREARRCHHWAGAPGSCFPSRCGRGRLRLPGAPWPQAPATAPLASRSCRQRSCA